MKLIIFDLDGVLVAAKELHYTALNDALAELDEKYAISWEDHLSVYDGLKTRDKLDMLTDKKGLPKDRHDSVWRRKQEITIEKFDGLRPDKQIKECLEHLSKDYKIACCTNSIRKTAFTALSRLDIIDKFDLILSNEDVENAKPHPEIYWRAMAMMRANPEETLIVEDSPHGLLAAKRSNANILRVKNPSEITAERIESAIQDTQGRHFAPAWKDKKMNVLIPMAGAGSRFEKAGYTFPKPLIEVNGKPMIQIVVENLNIDANYIYVVQKSHREKFNLDALLNLITPGCRIIEVDGITEGAACTALLAKEHIDNNQPLFFANSDQYVEWDSNEFMYKMNESGVDGGIVTFKSTHPKWSFAKVNAQGLVEMVAEKNPISSDATVGFYYWRSGSDFVKYAEQMINKNIRVNGEFYVCPVFNQAIDAGMKIKTFEADKMWGLGTPEDLNYFLEHHGA